MTLAELHAFAMLAILSVPIGVLPILAASARWVPHEDLPVCGRCAYDLNGLDPVAACPECGSSVRRCTWRRAIDWERVRRFSQWLVATVIAAIVFSPLLRLGWVGLYLSKAGQHTPPSRSACDVRISRWRSS